MTLRRWPPTASPATPHLHTKVTTAPCRAVVLCGDVAKSTSLSLARSTGEPAEATPPMVLLVSIKKNHNTYSGHYGEMASWQMRGTAQ